MTPMRTDDAIAQRRAIEALRAGVPNRDAVRALGCAQPGIEDRFRRQLETIGPGADEAARGHGLLIVGGFGAGKSHMLECLQHLALEANFVCSKVVVSKETPLHDPAKLYRAAIEAAVVPGSRGAALAEIVRRLDFRGDAYRDLYDWVHHSGGELNSRFAATLFLFQRTQNDPELQDRVIRFWAGEPIGVGELKKLLREVRETVTYPIERIPNRELALQRFNFASRLILTAGYAGWVLLVDEVELIGRYSLLQRAKSYGEVARWMGKLKGPRVRGLTAVLAITDDFQGAILEEKDDLEKVPNKLRARATEADLLLADHAELGMRAIQREGVALTAPDAAVLAQTYRRVRAIHAHAYGWEPPEVRSVERLGSTRMREYVKGWITEWDLTRLDPSYDVQLESEELRPTYAEDENLTVPTDEAADEAPD